MRQVLVVCAVAFTLWLSVQLRVILVDVVIAITLAAAMAPLAVRLEQKNVPRGATVLLTYVTVAAFYATIGYLLWKPIKEQAQLLAENVPNYIASVNAWYESALLHFGMTNQLKLSEADFQNIGNMVLHRTLDVSAGVLGIMLNAVLVLFLATYFVMNSHRIWDALLKWVPPEHRSKAASLVGPVGNRMGGYVRGQALVSTAVATFFAIGLSLIGVKYALVLGLVAGVLNLVPFVGSMITTVFAVVIAANQSWLTAALTVALFALEQTIESNFIVPVLLGSQVELDPLIVLLAILIGGTLGGAVGALIAVPITSALLLIAQELYLKPMQEQESL